MTEKTYKHLSAEDVKAIKTWAKNAKEASEKLTVVLNGIKRQMSKTNGENKTAKCVDKNWKEFVEEFNNQMPHIVKAGTKKIVPCDWVKATDKTKFNVFFSEYRVAGEELVNFGGEELPNGKISYKTGSFIMGKYEEVQKIKFVHPSGHEEEIPEKDKDGNVITKTVECKFVPREKTAWGYTETVVNAFIAAADEIMEREANKK